MYPLPKTSFIKTSMENMTLLDHLEWLDAINFPMNPLENKTLTSNKKSHSRTRYNASSMPNIKLSQQVHDLLKSSKNQVKNSKNLFKNQNSNSKDTLTRLQNLKRPNFNNLLLLKSDQLLGSLTKNNARILKDLK